MNKCRLRWRNEGNKTTTSENDEKKKKKFCQMKYLNNSKVNAALKPIGIYFKSQKLFESRMKETIWKVYIATNTEYQRFDAISWRSFDYCDVWWFNVILLQTQAKIQEQIGREWERWNWMQIMFVCICHFWMHSPTWLMPFTHFSFVCFSPTV